MRRMLLPDLEGLLELRQDPRLLRVVLVAPILQLIILGYAATTDVKNVPIVVVDDGRTPASRELIERFDASPYFTRRRTSWRASTDRSVPRARTRLDGAVDPARVRPAASASGAPATVQVVADGSDANSTTWRSGTPRTWWRATRRSWRRRAPPPAGRRPHAAASKRGVRVWFNPQLESRDFMIPGVLALLLLVDDRGAGVDGDRAREGAGHARAAERHAAPPLGADRRQAAALRASSAWSTSSWSSPSRVFWFQVPLRGSFALLFALSIVYLLSTLGLGLFVSTISQNPAAGDDDRGVLLRRCR